LPEAGSVFVFSDLFGKQRFLGYSLASWPMES